ncbi:MAG: diguanylate cyclase domain-containing protein [Acidobacteriota bacterium]
MSSFINTMIMGTPTQLRRLPKETWPLLLVLSLLIGLALTSSSQLLIHTAGVMLLAASAITPVWFMNRWRRHVRVAEAAEATWQALLDGSQDALMVLHERRDDMGQKLGFRVSRANRQAHAWFGHGRRDLIGADLTDLFPLPQHKLFFQSLRRAQKTRLSVTQEHLYQVPAPSQPGHESGQAPTWLHHQIIPIPEGIALVSRDTSETHHAMEALKEQESFYRTLVDSLPVAVVAKSVRPQTQDQYLVWNRAAADSMHLPTQTVLGKTPREVMPPEIAQRSEQHDAIIMQAPQTHHFQGLPFRTPAGERILDLIKTPVYGADGEMDHILTIARDMTEQRQAAEKLRLASRVIDETGDAVVVTDALDRILMVNPAFTQLSGLTPAEVIGKSAELMGLPALRESHLAGIEAALQLHQRWSGESHQVCHDGRKIDTWMSVSVLRNEAGKVAQHIRVFSDISALKARQRELIEQARHDSLTGLPNRRAFEERLDQAIARARRSKQTLAVCYVDLDGFKGINDQHGHAAGDKVLSEVSRRLLSCVRTTDTVCRLAGDEFTVILEGAGHLVEVERICGRMVDTLSLPQELKAGTVALSASVGVAIWEMSETADSLCLRADKAMYAAKHAGKAQFRLAEGGGTLDLLMTPRLVGA